MAHESESANNEIKVHFNTREGKYQQITNSDFFYSKRGPFVSPSTPSRTALVKTSYVRVKQSENEEEEDDCICFTVGKTLLYFTYNTFRQLKQCNFLDKRQYKGSAPSCHDINQFTASAQSVKVAVGFLAGQVQIIDVRKKESLQIMNEVRSVDKSSVTCVKWFPNSENMILSAHICGFMYTYDVTQSCSELTPTYHPQPYKVDDGYSIYTVKSKSTSAPGNSCNSSSSIPNPLYKWVMSTDGTAVCAFEFSPCTRFVAVVTQNGYLRVINHQTFESHGWMKSYFGGLMTCSWSPDGRLIATGGEDDLITVWSFCQQRVVARGSSHKSWVSDIAFDAALCVIPSDADMKTYYGMPTVDEFLASRKSNVQSSHDSSENLPEAGHDPDDPKSPSLLKFKKRNSNDTAPEPASSGCNGDSKFALSAEKMKRLRTYSNVSRVSRLSIGIDRPSVCYRLGSVGQDSQFCLWEIDESTFDLINRKSSVLKRREASSKENRKQSPTIFPASENTVGSTSDLPLVAESSSSELSSGGSSNVQYYLHNQTPAHNQCDLSPLEDESRSNSVPHSINSAIQSKKDARPKNSSNGFSVIRKFATIGSHDRSRKESKQQQQHKRNLSLPHFGLRSSASQNGGSKSGLHKTEQPIPQIFGTILCPSLEDTPMLDPLTCKKISQSRLTSLAFKQECILISSQDGSMQIWLRPNIDDSKSPSSVQSSESEPMKQNGTVV